MKTILALVILLNVSTGFALEVILGVEAEVNRRCTTVEPPLRREKHLGRNLFAWKCEENKYLKAQIAKRINDNLPGYFVYGHWDEEKERYTNPERWTAPTSVTGKCSEIPKDYGILFFCGLKYPKLPDEIPM